MRANQTDLDKLELRDHLELVAQKPEVGQIIVTSSGKYKIYHVFIKGRYYDETESKMVTLGLETLRGILNKFGVNQVRISRSGDATDTLFRGRFLELLRETFNVTEIKITLCYGLNTVPDEKSREGIIKEAHDSLLGEHKGENKTYKRIRGRFYWPCMKNDITEYVRTCEQCQLVKLTRVKTRMPMFLTDTPLNVFDKLAIDTVGPLPVTPDGYRHVLTMQCLLTKYCIAVTVLNIKAITISHALATNFIAIYGAPKVILSDKGTSFLNKVFRELARIFKISLLTTSGYRPQTNGSLERSHMVLTEYLKNNIEYYENWDKMVPFAMFSYNTSVHESKNFPPYEMVFGRTERSPSPFPDTKSLETYSDYVVELVTRLNEIQKLGARNLNLSKAREKRYYD